MPADWPSSALKPPSGQALGDWKTARQTDYIPAGRRTEVFDAGMSKQLLSSATLRSAQGPRSRLSRFCPACSATENKVEPRRGRRRVLNPRERNYISRENPAKSLFAHDFASNLSACVLGR